MSNALKTMAFTALLGLGTALCAAAPSYALDKVSYGTNWLAQAEHGGFYQAVADGTYAKHGLEVTIVQGGPNAANTALLISGKIDFYMGGPQGYLSSEPYEIQKQTGWEPKVFLLADNGYSPYSTAITTTQPMIDGKSDVVQRFVDASIEGWYNYLYGDNAKANDLIKKDNPEMTDGQIAYSIAKMKEYGIVESGEALDKGIGCMTDAHYKKFFDEMVG